MNKDDKRAVLDFKKEVLKALHKGIINSVEAKECLIVNFLYFFYLEKEILTKPILKDLRR
jgi:hypothetical protein